MNIKQNLVKNFSSRENHIADTIVVHISAGSLTSMTSWFSTPNSQASSHYGISKSGEIIQYVLETDKAWTQGNVNKPSSSIVISRPGVNPNLYCLSIENEGLDLLQAPQLQLDTLYALIKDIATRNKIPLDRKHILGHFEIDSVNRVNCPSPNHSIMDKIVESLQIQEQMVSVPRKLLEELLKYL